jgi:hypothetical protein
MKKFSRENFVHMTTMLSGGSFFLVVVSFELLLFGSVVIFVAIPLCGARESEVETGREGVPHARVSQS